MSGPKFNQGAERASTVFGALCGVFILIIGVFAAAIALTACTTLGSAPAPSAQRTVYAAENSFTIALRVAVAYEALPLCGPSAPAICATTPMIAKVTAAARAARASLSTAETAVRSSTDAQAMAVAASQAQADVSAFAALAGGLSK